MLTNDTEHSEDGKNAQHRVLKHIYFRKYLNVHSVCTNLCLNVHGVCTNFCLKVHGVCTNLCVNVHSPCFLCSPFEYGKSMYKFVFYA